MIYVAKVIYLISSDADTAIQTEEQRKVGSIEQEQEEGVEKETIDNTEENKDEDDKEMDKEQQEMQGLLEQKKENSPTLLWVINKLSLLAKTEAANTPKVFFKVCMSVQF